MEPKIANLKKILKREIFILVFTKQSLLSFQNYINFYLEYLQLLGVKS